MIAIVDYGVGNLFSIKSSFSTIGADSIITSDRSVIEKSDEIVLPGVGAFSDAAKKLRDLKLSDVIIDCAENGKPLLGICLGMQLMFEKSYEYGEHNGLGLIPGKIVSISDVIPEHLKVPHIGWNSLHFVNGKSPIFKYINENDRTYFVHSYYASDCDSSTIATTEYGAELTAAVACKNVFGCQFHPEKSGNVGLNILRAFCEIKGE